VPPHPFTGIPKSVAAALAVCTRFGRTGFALSFWRFPDKPDARRSREAALAAQAEGKIDDPANLAASRVWLFHGQKDAGVPRATIAEMASFYRMMGVPAGNIAEEEGPDAEHGMPVKARPPAPTGPHCAPHDPSFLVSCDYGAAELLLRHLYPGAAAAAGAAAGRIVGFDQTEFFDGEPRTSLNAVGYLYVPAACENGAPAAVACRLHVACAEHGMPVKAQPPAPTGGHCALHDPAFLTTVACNTSTRSTTASSATPATTPSPTRTTSSCSIGRRRGGGADRPLRPDRQSGRLLGLVGTSGISLRPPGTARMPPEMRSRTIAPQRFCGRCAESPRSRNPRY
jgi:hypothetical protein